MMISQKDLRSLAVELFNIGAVKPGNPRTPIYLDLKQLLSQPKLLARVSTMMWLLTDPREKYDRVCGAPFNALSRCGVPYRAITYAYHISIQTKVPMLMRCRSTTSNLIEGEFEIGDRVAIVDDETTNGNNILEIAMDLLKEKLKIGEALVVVDREQGGCENLENAGIKLKSLFKISELIEYLRDAGKIPDGGRRTIRAKDNANAVRVTKKMPVCNVKDRNTRRSG